MILLVDDDEVCLDVEKLMVESIGYRALIAGDRLEALNLFREYASDITCVIMDMIMPQTDPEQVFDEIKEIKPDAIVIITSGYGKVDVQYRFKGREIAGFIQKPFQQADLAAKIKTAIDARMTAAREPPS